MKCIFDYRLHFGEIYGIVKNRDINSEKRIIFMLELQNLSYTVPDGKQNKGILNGVDLIIPETDPIRSDVGIHEIPFEIPVQAEDDP